MPNSRGDPRKSRYAETPCSAFLHCGTYTRRAGPSAGLQTRDSQCACQVSYQDDHRTVFFRKWKSRSSTSSAPAAQNDETGLFERYKMEDIAKMAKHAQHKKCAQQCAGFDVKTYSQPRQWPRVVQSVGALLRGFNHFCI